MIKLSELDAARIGMSLPEDWRHDENNYRCIEIAGNDDVWIDNSCDARGLVATIKAADALIAVVKAALAWQATGFSAESNLRDALMYALRAVSP